MTENFTPGAAPAAVATDDHALAEWTATEAGRLLLQVREGGLQGKELKDAGDMSGVADVSSVVRLCARFPQNKFFVTMLARENQHELCVAARKFGNLMVFGCWWFLNNPSLIEEITRMRIELLGSSVIPQHSDSRVLDQLLYKWEHSRAVIGKVLTDQYTRLLATGWPLTTQDIERDVARMAKENFIEFLARA